MNILKIITLLLIFNIFYVRIVNNKSIIFLEYLIYFCFFSIFIFFIDLVLPYELIPKKYFLLYLLFFLSSFLTIGLKYFKSPTDFIYQKLSLNKGGVKRNELVKYIQKKRIIKKRFNDLKRQKLIFINKNIAELTLPAKRFAELFNKIKKFYHIKIEG